MQVVATALAYPFEVACRLQIMAIGQLKGLTLGEAMGMATRQGFLYRGLVLCLGRNSIANVLQFKFIPSR